MTSHVLLALSSAIALGAATLAWTQALRAVRSVGDLPKLSAKLKRSPIDERPAALVELAAPGSWERALGEELVATADPALRVVTANEALDDLAHELDVRSDWPRAAAYIGFFGAALVGVVEYILTREFGSGIGVAAPGAVSLFACVEARRRARAGIHRRKVEVDGLVDAVMGAAAREQALASASRRRRRRDF